jgi:glycosyltransferase involved in cell wall biosynthesis
MLPLRVALDGRPLQSVPLGGVGRYLAGTIPLLARHVEVRVLLDARNPSPAVDLGAAELVKLPAPPGVPGLGWLELAVAPWLRRFGGVFHGTFNVLPLSFRGRCVLTVHDLAPQLHPEDFRFSRRISWRLNMRSSVLRARCVTTVSSFVKGQLVDYFGLSPERIVVAPDALDPIFSPHRAADAPSEARRLGIPTPYIVALGGAPRRGLSVAIQASRRAIQQHGQKITLVVLGQPQLASEPGLVSVGYLEDGVWATLLAGAQALCYPTRYEGFGLPALEAAASGTPVVCAPVASLPEVLGDAGCWATEPSAEAIAAVLTRVLSDPDWRTERREAGLERARKATSWPETADALTDAYERAAR